MVLGAPAPVETRPLAPAERPEPSAGPGEVVVRVEACAVCRTDLHVVEGDLPASRRPVVPGHQVVGRVEAVGAGVALRPGSRVGAAWLHASCQACRFCLSGRENLCLAPRFTGYDEDGGYAEKLKARADFLYPLEESDDPAAVAPLLCAGIIGYRALKRCAVKPGGRLGLYGFGGSAHIALQAARSWACEVLVFTRGESRRALARELGASWTGEPGERPPKPLDAAVLFAPSGDLVPLALEALDRGGTLAIAGIHLSAIPPLDYARHLFQEKTVLSVTANTREDGRELLALARRAGIQTKVREFPLARANEALLALKTGGIDGSAVLRP